MRPTLMALMTLALALPQVFAPALAVAAPLAQATPVAQATSEGGPNLLKNGDFEVNGDTWPMQDGIGEVQAALGWRAYFVDKPPKYVVRPVFCYEIDPAAPVPKPKP